MTDEPTPDSTPENTPAAPAPEPVAAAGGGGGMIAEVAKWLILVGALVGGGIYLYQNSAEEPFYDRAKREQDAWAEEFGGEAAGQNGKNSKARGKRGNRGRGKGKANSKSERPQRPGGDDESAEDDKETGDEG